ncbi:SDR family NAD(P)-dependent oxidoreductase [Streptomyces coeruleorubidus]|uniref:SDR family NAD(P)-dependent oxidoreductase n=1 Tax=Streptomyces coeruleorubidus TaxID=116188 RepID=UPI00379DD938
MRGDDDLVFCNHPFQDGGTCQRGHDWNRMLDVNIRGYLNGGRAVLPVMLRQKSGHILNMDSVAGHPGPERGILRRRVARVGPTRRCLTSRNRYGRRTHPQWHTRSAPAPTSPHRPLLTPPSP